MNPDDYRSVLIKHFEARKIRNPSYSLRSYARDLGWSPSRLSDSINGKGGLSEKKAELIVKKLALPKLEQNLFVAMVAAEHARSAVSRKQAKQKAEKIRIHSGFQQVSDDAFKVIQDWYHLAIVELLKVKGFRSDPEWISQRLDVSKSTISHALKRLLQSGLLEMKGEKLISPKNRNEVGTGISSDAIKTFHIQILNKAIDAVYGQPRESRDLGASLVAVDKKDLPEISKRMSDFRRELCKEFGASSKQKEILYCISMQCFALSKEEQM